MPIPVPNPSPGELATLSEIVMLSDDETLQMVSSPTDQEISNAKWEATQNQMETWEAVKGDSGDIKKVGPIEFFDKAENTRLNFRNDIRRRYKIDILLDESGNTVSPSSSSSRSTSKNICFGW